VIGIDISFWILAIVCVAAALAVVTLKNIFHAALALVLCFLTIAGVYILLNAEFIAVVQILIYVGAISVIIILAIMMTRDLQQANISNKLKIPAFIISLGFFIIMLYTFLNTEWNISGTIPAENTTSLLAGKLFSPNGYVLQVEIAALLLLAAIIGAIVLMRDK